MTCNIANIKINLPTVAGRPPLHYLPPWHLQQHIIPSSARLIHLSFCCIYSPILLIPHLYLSHSVIIFTVSFFPHCALQLPFFISSTSPPPSSFSCLCCPSLPTSYWSSLPCWLNIYPSFHPFTVACICALSINFVYSKYRQFCCLASPSFSSSL